MPPKTPSRKDSINAYISSGAAKQQKLLEKSMSPEGVEIPIQSIRISCSEAYHGEIQTQYENKYPPEPEIKVYADYVDVYLNGELIAEGEPEKHVRTHSTKSNSYTWYNTIDVNYNFNASGRPHTVILHGKQVKKLFKTTEEYDLDRLNREYPTEVIYYYKGDEAFRLPATLELDKFNGTVDIYIGFFKTGAMKAFYRKNGR